MAGKMRAVARGCRFLGVFGLVVLGACTAISGAATLHIVDEVPDGRAPSELDGSSTDSGAPGDAASLDADADLPDTSNVIYRTGFDEQDGCEQWQTTGGSVVRDPAGHAAPGSCRLCAPAGGNVDLVGELTAPRRGWVTVEAWVREGKTDDVALGRMAIKYGGSNSESGFGLGDSWDSHVNHRLPIDTGVKMQVVFGLREAGAGDCMLVDDVVVRLEQ